MAQTISMRITYILQFGRKNLLAISTIRITSKNTLFSKTKKIRTEQ
tara:strand:- start:251 stop:388 length:138 start_codon:yes stop_codon:yes gene_type:complete